MKKYSLFLFMALSSAYLYADVTEFRSAKEAEITVESDIDDIRAASRESRHDEGSFEVQDESEVKDR